MHVTLSFLLKKNKLKFFHLKPTTYFCKWYVSGNRILPSLSCQKLPQIRRRELVKLL